MNREKQEKLVPSMNGRPVGSYCPNCKAKLNYQDFMEHWVVNSWYRCPVCGQMINKMDKF